MNEMFPYCVKPPHKYPLESSSITLGQRVCHHRRKDWGSHPHCPRLLFALSATLDDMNRLHQYESLILNNILICMNLIPCISSCNNQLEQRKQRK